jgi:hypothetical protein
MPSPVPEPAFVGRQAGEVHPFGASTKSPAIRKVGVKVNVGLLVKDNLLGPASGEAGQQIDLRR